MDFNQPSTFFSRIILEQFLYPNIFFALHGGNLCIGTLFPLSVLQPGMQHRFFVMLKKLLKKIEITLKCEFI
jgi:hypothetical protein